MSKKTQLIVLLTAAFVLTGCAGQQKSSKGTILADSEMVNIHLFAGRLTMTVKSIEKDRINIGNTDNTVNLYLDTDQVYVNNRYLTPLGRTKKIKGLLCVRASIVNDIQKVLPTKEPELVITPVKPSAELSLLKNHSKWLIIVDPGHGGKDPGAISPYGFYEKTVNLSVAAQITEMLKDKGYKVIMTRDDDTFIELEERAAIANRNKASLFISIHADSCATSTANGFTVYISRSASLAAKNLAGSIDNQMKKTGTKSKGTRKADFRVLVQSQCPAVLIELGYLSNYWEEKKLRNENMQRILAGAITAGIVNYTDK
ncbi:MAG: N-acetylmuramoyl-L-alanine amidase [Anaerohalosphaeraceae bacterium]|nr:N-acetylmuramoyl-L-alanine amidase [Anaerohalosphaeraceae bacterium]